MIQANRHAERGHTPAGAMTAALAHEINQPLAAIVNYLSTAQRLTATRPGLPQRLADALELAKAQAEHAAAVVARIRDLAVTRCPLRERLSVHELVDAVIALQAFDAQKQKIVIESRLPRELPAVVGDRVMIEQVLTNLLRNAADAMLATEAAQRRITVSASPDQAGRVALRIRDRGCGIPAAVEARVFTPLFSTKPGGMGVGLALCRSMVELNGGEIGFERNPDRGVTFVFTVPCWDRDTP
jgi:signal transduction histidine kinase